MAEFSAIQKLLWAINYGLWLLSLKNFQNERLFWDENNFSLRIWKPFEYSLKTKPSWNDALFFLVHFTGIFTGIICAGTICRVIFTSCYVRNIINLLIEDFNFKIDIDFSIEIIWWYEGGKRANLAFSLHTRIIISEYSTIRLLNEKWPCNII